VIRDFDARRPADRKRVMLMLEMLQARSPVHQDLVGRVRQLEIENLALRQEIAILREQLELNL